MKEGTIYVTKKGNTIIYSCLSPKAMSGVFTKATDDEKAAKYCELACQARLNYDKLGSKWTKDNNVEYPIVYEN